MFKNKKENKESKAKKLDKVVTWLIIGTAVASMVWLSQTNKWKEVTSEVKKWIKKWYSKSKSAFWTFLVKTIDFFNKKK